MKDYKLVRDGLSAPENKRIQDAFIAGELQVICATNAFGMGVDKEDVRLVVHLDIPGSLENYVQEAGRAGRGRLPALCVLLYDEQDLEGQFRMEAMSELTLLAVGDDDQNIYAFRGASLTFIRRFLTDYDAAPHYLVENYRSTANVIQAGNALISNNRERMKTDRPIRIDRRRRGQPPGGRWETLDPLARGRVLVLDAADPGLQAAALVARIRQLRQLRGGAWTDFALLARTRGVLEPIRALCESERIPVAWREDLPPLHRVREIADFVDRLRSMGQEPCMAESLGSLLPEHVGPWRRLLERLRCPW